MYVVRKWSVTNARYFMWFYHRFEGVMIRLHPLWLKLGYDRVAKPITFLERHTKSFLFDCQMCGKCLLSQTGMSCPMNCPKQLRNGPCGGVREDGSCEVDADMRCVWVEAWRGAQSIKDGKITAVNGPVDHRLKGTSSWLREVKEKRDQQFYQED